nr:reductive dehalogenase [uncultured bacterium]
MSNFHSTVSRRDFMRGLGLAGAGLGAAAAAAPVFKDLDELTLSTPEVREKPWWVKERDFDNPTVEVDWENKEPFDGRKRDAWITGEMSEEWQTKQVELIKEGISQNIPGKTLKDQAFANSGGLLFAGSNAFEFTQLVRLDYMTTIMDTFDSSRKATNVYGFTREQMGIPPWQGTPEENARMISALLHFYGSTRVGFAEITEKTKKVWFSHHYSTGKTFEFADVDQPFSDDERTAVIPSKCRYLISFVIPQSGISKYHNTALSRAASWSAYSDASLMAARLQIFLRTLGYEGVPDVCGANNIGFGVLSGNGELGRTNYLVNPWNGALIRKADFMLTDLPLAPTKPIDAGIFRFCRTCKKCAEMCPSGSLSLETEPTWEIINEQNGYGQKAYHNDWHKCRPYAWTPSVYSVGGCSVCQDVCVFSKMEKSSVHDLVKPVVASTSLFNGLFKRMDDMFNYNNPKNPEDWWNRDFKNYPYSGNSIQH